MKQFPTALFIVGVLLLMSGGLYTLLKKIALTAAHPLVLTAPLPAPPAFDAATVMRMAISLGLLGASLFVILSKRYTPTDRHWAYATVGTILGFWLPK